MNQSKLFKVNIHDLSQSALNAAIAAIFVGLAGIMGNSFDVFTADWVGIGKSVLNWGFAGFFSTFVNSLLTDSEGTTHLGIATIKRK